MPFEKGHTARRNHPQTNLAAPILPEIEESPRREAILRRRAQIPTTMKRAYDRAVLGRSLKAAAKAFCSECVGWDREEVRLCTALACPLWKFRPFQKKEGK